MLEFKRYPKIPRLENAKYTYTEKIDGTNGCIVIYGLGACMHVQAQSRQRILTLDNDNFGFAAWVESHRDELLALGVGYHYGEWWGQGIQRQYGLKERRFSLFAPWKALSIPSCCHVVPEIEADCVEDAVNFLKNNGSVAEFRYMNPEGVIMRDKHYPDVLYKYIINK